MIIHGPGEAVKDPEPNRGGGGAEEGDDKPLPERKPADQRIHTDNIVSISVEEIADIKKRVSLSFAAVLVGPVFQALEKDFEPDVTPIREADGAK